MNHHHHHPHPKPFGCLTLAVTTSTQRLASACLRSYSPCRRRPCPPGPRPESATDSPGSLALTPPRRRQMPSQPVSHRRFAGMNRDSNRDAQGPSQRSIPSTEREGATSDLRTIISLPFRGRSGCTGCKNLHGQLRSQETAIPSQR